MFNIDMLYYLYGKFIEIESITSFRSGKNHRVFCIPWDKHGITVAVAQRGVMY